MADSNLRFYRTMLLGRVPGMSPGPAAVGPWREVALERQRGLAVETPALSARLDDETGVLDVSVDFGVLDDRLVESVTVELDGPSGLHGTTLDVGPTADHARLRARGELRVPRVARWWPHSHGEPALHAVTLTFEHAGAEPLVLDAGRVGFRSLAPGPQPEHDIERDGLSLHINGVQVFARGPVWTPCDPVGLACPPEQLQATLGRVRDAGMNIVRLPGTGAYETPAFHDLCDALGIMVWQDFMFANYDYPAADEEFREAVGIEVSAVLEDLRSRPSLVVLCGNSEVEQQVAMLGLDQALGRQEPFEELIPDLVRASGVDAAYVPSAPCGGALPFRPGVGVANYYGVGAYRRPLEDARRAGVRFAAESLAFANVAEARDGAGDGSVLGRTPRMAGWRLEFEDFRDHYLNLLFGLDSRELRLIDPERYWALSRAVTGEIMAEVLGEWRRAESPCAGALILWLRDLPNGTGWGLLDEHGRPKPVYHYLRRALAPVAVWSIDEGLGGIAAHVGNDRPEELACELHVVLYSDGEVRVGEGVAEVRLGGHEAGVWDVEEVLGRFVDASWAYRFGPPAQQAVALSLCEPATGALLSHTVRFPAGHPLEREAPERTGLSAQCTRSASGALALRLRSRRLLYGVTIEAPGHLPADNWLTLEPNVDRVVELLPARGPSGSGRAAVGALNMRGSVRFDPEPSA